MEWEFAGVQTGVGVQEGHEWEGCGEEKFQQVSAEPPPVSHAVHADVYWKLLADAAAVRAYARGQSTFTATCAA
jgi:hypothetical protein